MTISYIIQATGERFSSLKEAMEAAKEIGGSAIYEWVVTPGGRE